MGVGINDKSRARLSIKKIAGINNRHDQMLNYKNRLLFSSVCEITHFLDYELYLTYFIYRKTVTL